MLNLQDEIRLVVETEDGLLVVRAYELLSGAAGTEQGREFAEDYPPVHPNSGPDKPGWHYDTNDRRVLLRGDKVSNPFYMETWAERVLDGAYFADGTGTRWMLYQHPADGTLYAVLWGKSRAEERAEESTMSGADTLIRGLLRVDWVDLAEGLSGEYDPDDPGDVSLLRFDVYGRTDDTHTYPAGWAPLDDASYCTQVPLDTPPEQKRALLWFIMDALAYPYTTSGLDPAVRSVKKVCEQLSWLEPTTKYLQYLDWVEE